MTAELETTGALQGLAEDQASPVVEGFERLGIEIVDAGLLTPRLGGAAFDRPPSRGSLAKNAIQPATRDERRVGGWTTHRVSFLGFIDHLSQD